MKIDSLHTQIASHCIHFTGLSKSVCGKGMNYDEIDKDMKLPMRTGLPCLKTSDKYMKYLEGRSPCHCPHLQFPSEEEIQVELQAYAEAERKMMLALVVIDPIRVEHKGKNWRGVIECPNCQGKLHVSHAGINGHVHAKCETEDCVSWME